MDTEEPSRMRAGSTTDAGKYLDRVGEFLRRLPVEHNVLLNAAATAIGEDVAEPGSSHWFWVEDDQDVVATAMHTPAHGVYLSTGPPEAMRIFAATIWRLCPELPGVTGLGKAAHEFAAEWSRLGGPHATPGMRQGLYAAEEVNIPLGIAGRFRPALDADAPMLCDWLDHFVAEAGVASRAKNEVASRIDAGLLFVWQAGNAVVSMAAITVAQSGVSRVLLVYTPPQHRRRGFASACVAALTARELATPGRTCMLNTDLSNPTSNDIYQAIGYRRVGEADELTLLSSTEAPGS
jgi:GNAT superfamily N-acetyltransferase